LTSAVDGMFVGTHVAVSDSGNFRLATLGDQT